jgi:hypothetical protein
MASRLDFGRIVEFDIGHYAKVSHGCIICAVDIMLLLIRFSLHGLRFFEKS